MREPGLWALDVGTGPGQLAFYLAQEGFSVTGIDISPGMIEHACQQAEEQGLGVDFRFTPGAHGHQSGHEAMHTFPAVSHGLRCPGTLPVFMDTLWC